ncbi:MAG: GGDEF domain-containing protein [Sulfurovum sp.]|nr:GGDEF domain-containing protein [Sulfurovum sp.]
MNRIYDFCIYNLDIVGTIILIASLFPIIKLMQELPSGHFRKWWAILIVMIFFFIIGYMYYVQQHHYDSGFFQNAIIPYILFFGSLFVFFTTTLFLRTTLDIKRIYTLEIENSTDPLMGIYNRRHLSRILDKEFSKAVRYSQSLTILMLDIDFFKKINDNYGHDIGDIVLKNLGILLKELVRETDSVARYGGEEIMIVSPLIDGQHAVELAERLRQKIEACIMVPADVKKGIAEIHITVSIGIAEYTPNISSVEDLIKRSDMALYRAKNEGRNCIFICNGTTPETVLLEKAIVQYESLKRNSQKNEKTLV